MLDTVFLTCYALGLFISGSLGDRVDLRYFLSTGMIAAGAGTAMFGIARWFDIHSLWWFVAANMLAGLAQSTGWPSCVTIMSRWFGKHKRGTIFGVWNSHGSVGSVMFKLLCNAMLLYIGWEYAFIVPGMICIGTGVLLFATLHVDPKTALSSTQYQILAMEMGDTHVNGHGQNHHVDHHKHGGDDSHHQQSQVNNHSAIGFFAALAVPGVVPYSLCLAFCKFIAYSFFMWLPFYLSTIGYGIDTANKLSTLFDIGGVLGGIVAGYASDKLGMRGVTCAVMLILCVPTMLLYLHVAAISALLNGAVMLLLGILVIGPYTLVSSAVAADLGAHHTLAGNTKAMATVTGIIDGIGSIGGAMNGVVCSFVGEKYGWNSVLYLLMAVALASCACITQVVYHEVTAAYRSRYTVLHSHDSSDHKHVTGRSLVDGNDVEDTPRSQPLLGSSDNLERDDV